MDTGLRPGSCPWQAFSDPLVIAVLNLYGACTSDMGTVPALAAAMHPPKIVLDGLTFYCSVIGRIRASDRKLEEQRRAQANQR